MLLNITRRGFTLVELSVALIIIGAIVAGIMAGSALVKQAELRSVMSDFKSLGAAYNNFTLKYDRIPGDMENATSYWPNDGQCLAVVAGNEDLCNGDGDNIIYIDEVVPALKHLSLAEMIHGHIDVISPTFTSLAIGTTALESQIEGAGYFFASGGTIVDGFEVENIVLVIGREPTGSKKANVLRNGALTPDDAFGIDQKMDDGALIFDEHDGLNKYNGAATGKIRATTGDDAASQCVSYDWVNLVLKGWYNLDVPTEACVLGFTVN